MELVGKTAIDAVPSEASYSRGVRNDEDESARHQV
jgi:hypothetical protein